MDMTPDTHQYGRGRPALPFFTYVISPHIFLAFILAIRPRASLYWRIATWVGFTSVLLSATRFDTGEDFDNWSVGILLLCSSFTAFVLLFLWDPAAECKHESFAKGEVIEKMPFWRRVYLMLCVIYSVRGIGWNYEVSCVFIHSPRCLTAEYR